MMLPAASRPYSLRLAEEKSRRWPARKQRAAAGQRHWAEPHARRRSMHDIRFLGTGRRRRAPSPPGARCHYARFEAQLHAFSCLSPACERAAAQMRDCALSIARDDRHAANATLTRRCAGRRRGRRRSGKNARTGQAARRRGASGRQSIHSYEAKRQREAIERSGRRPYMTARAPPPRLPRAPTTALACRFTSRWAFQRLR